MRLVLPVVLALLVPAAAPPASAETGFFFRSKPATFTAADHHGLPAVSLGAHPDGALYVGELASYSFSAAGGAAPYAWSVSGAPQGLAVTAAGVLSGAPASAGSFDAAVTVTDARGATASASVRIEVAGALVADIPSQSAATVQVGKPLSLRLGHRGGIGPVAWTLSDLPAWASSTSAGEVTGTPQSASVSTMTATVRDARGHASSVTFPLTAKAPSESFVAIGWGGAASSRDGATWTRRTLPTSRLHYAGAHGGGRFVAVAEGNTVAWSDDGTTWAATPGGSGMNELKAVAYGNGRFVAVAGNGNVATSSDGKAWSAGKFVGYGANHVGLAFGDGRFVLANGGGVWSSTDGGTWTKAPGISGGGSVDYVNGRWVVGNPDANLVSSTNRGTIRTSTDLTTWTLSDTSFNNFGGTAYGNGVFVSVGVGANIGRSTDGTNWTAAAGPAGANGGNYDVKFANGRFHIVGDGGYVMSSVDGLAWTLSGAPLGFSTFALVVTD